MNPLLIRRRGMMAGKTLPYDAQVEYLESNGTQYIDVGFVGSIDINYEVKASVTMASQFNHILGDRYSSSARRFTLMFSNEAEPAINVYFNAGTSNQKSGSANTLSPTIAKKYALDVFINGQLTGTLSTSSLTSPHNMILFGARNNNSLSSMLYGRIYYCKFWNGATLVRDYFPVRVGTVGYMYDRVSGQLFGNDGTGDFILGPDVI